MIEARLIEDAQECRVRALAYVGRPEAVLLLKTAREFERLAQDPGRAAALTTLDRSDAGVF